MRFSSFISASALFASVQSINLYVSSYSDGPWAGNITTLSLDRSANGSYALTQVASTNTSTNSPSWLTLNRHNGVLYVTDEAWSTPNGTVASYRTSFDGKLQELKRVSVPTGGVHGAFFANGKRIAVSHYGGSLLQTYSVTPDGEIAPQQSFNLSDASFTPGPVIPRQAVPRPHQAILDPSGRFLLVPDLGQDQIHFFYVDNESYELTQLPSMSVPTGFGPRHGVFSTDKINGSYWFYLLGEISDHLSVYKVDYQQDDTPNMVFTQSITINSTMSDGKIMPLNTDGSTAAPPAEIAITPDGKTLLISNRNDTTYGTKPPIDSLASFSISPSDGSLTRRPSVSAYGSFPRHFALNRAGDMLAVPTQQSGKLVVLGRNQTSGLFERLLANFEFDVGANSPNCVVWDE